MKGNVFEFPLEDGEWVDYDEKVRAILAHHDRFLIQFPTHRQRFPLECRISQVSGREHDQAVTNIFVSLICIHYFRMPIKFIIRKSI